MVYYSSFAVPSTLFRVRLLAGAASSVDLRFLPVVALRGAAVVRDAVGLRWAF